MLKRKIEKYLEVWLKTKYGLFVDGARQVGKTFTLKHFLEKHFENLIYINLLMNKTALETLRKSINPKDFMFRLSTVIDKKFIPGKTAIFIDEIQEFGDFDLVTYMKELIEEGSYRFVLSGSLLGVSLYNVDSWPSGYMSSIKMYPLDFEEFLWANKVNEEVIKHVKQCFQNKKVVEDYIYDKFMDIFHKYLLVGGMPEAVNTYLEHNDFNIVALAHDTIEKYNKKDVSKYAQNSDKLKIQQLYELLPEEINSKSKRFKTSDLKNLKRSENLDISFKWLTDAGVAIATYNVSEPVSPLRINLNRTLIKLFHEDVGMLTSLLMDSSLKMKILNQEKNINYGAIYENVVAQLLNCHGFERQFYYANKKYGEVDFIIELNGNVIPLEIKSGKDYARHSALNNLLTIENYAIPEAYVFYNGNVKRTQKITYFPIFMIEFLHKRNIYFN